MLRNNYVNYSSILRKDPPIYDFTLYTPNFNFETEDNDGWIDRTFYTVTDQDCNEVPKEMSDMDLEKLEIFFKKHVPEDGLFVEIGVWRNPNNKDIVSTQVIFDIKHDNCSYLGIDIENRPHILNKKPNVHFLQSDSADYNKIKNYIDTNIKKEIDFLFIDGLHSVEQVKKELALVNLVKKGGVIGFHDISVHAGPNMWIEAFDPEKFDIYKFRNNNDWGVGFIVKKF
jgi:hypothetical protein